MSRSEHRIPKLRSRGRENRRKLLAHAERLLLAGDGAPLRFSEVFEAAGVSRGSAYRIYIGIDDLLHDLATEWVNNFVDFMKTSSPASAPASWFELSDYVVRQGGRYWVETADTLRVLPRIRAATPSSYGHAVRALADCIVAIFERYFVLPQPHDWKVKMAFYAQICDVTFATALREGGQLNEQSLLEAETLCRAYLSLYLPAKLIPKNSLRP